MPRVAWPETPVTVIPRKVARTSLRGLSARKSWPSGAFARQQSRRICFLWSIAEVARGAADRAIHLRQRQLHHFAVAGCEAGRVQIPQQKCARERQFFVPGEDRRKREEQPQIAGHGHAAGGLKGVSGEQRAVAF